jgi:hypothetical protein
LDGVAGLIVIDCRRPLAETLRGFSLCWLYFSDSFRPLALDEASLGGLLTYETRRVSGDSFLMPVVFGSF